MTEPNTSIQAPPSVDAAAFADFLTLIGSAPNPPAPGTGTLPPRPAKSLESPPPPKTPWRSGPASVYSGVGISCLVLVALCMILSRQEPARVGTASSGALLNFAPQASARAVPATPRIVSDAPRVTTQASTLVSNDPIKLQIHETPLREYRRALARRERILGDASARMLDSKQWMHSASARARTLAKMQELVVTCQAAGKKDQAAMVDAVCDKINHAPLRR